MNSTLLRSFILVGLIAFGGLYYYSSQVEEQYGEPARSYLDTALSSISSWQPAALRAQLSRETLAQVNDKQLAGLSAQYQHLGQYQRMDELRFSRLSGALSLFADSPRLSYSSKLYFENGSAIMTATLTLQDQRFKLYNFNLATP